MLFKKRNRCYLLYHVKQHVEELGYQAHPTGHHCKQAPQAFWEHTSVHAGHLHIPEASHSKEPSTPYKTCWRVIIYTVPHTCTLPHTGKRQSHGGCRSQNADFQSLADITGLLFAIGNLLAWKHFPDFLHLFSASLGKMGYSQVIHKRKRSIIDSAESLYSCMHYKSVLFLPWQALLNSLRRHFVFSMARTVPNFSCFKPGAVPEQNLI